MEKVRTPHSHNYTAASLVAFAWIISAACAGRQHDAGPAGVPNEATREAIRIEASALDRSHTTKTGATLLVPKGWHGFESMGVIRLQGPGDELGVAIIELSNDSAASAIGEALIRAGIDAPTEVEQELRLPAEHGFDEIVLRQYKIDPTLRRVAYALARRAGARVFVQYASGNVAEHERRGAQVNQIVGSLKAPGHDQSFLTNKTPKPFDERAITTLRAFVDEALRMTGIPGASVAVVQGSRVVFAEGFGVTQHGSHIRVTADTAMMIGSTTKSMTTLLIGQLVDRGLFKWDMPATKAFPTFRLGSREATESATVQHLVCACTGMPRRDMQLLFEFENVSPEQMLKQLGEMTPTTGFGEVFQYSNQMVAAAGFFAAQRLYGGSDAIATSYTRAMQELVFKPVGMPRSTFSFDEVVENGDFARPHGMTLEGAFQPLPLRMEHFVLPVLPTGGAWSTARDMARYLVVELGNGRNEAGRQVVSEASVSKRREPQIPVSDTTFYGLGWLVTDLHGQPLVSHGGATLGFSSDLAFLPKAQIGVVVLANGQYGGALGAAVRRRVLELVFDTDLKANEKLATSVGALRAQFEAARKELDHESGGNTLRHLVGQTLHHPELGALSVHQDEREVVVDAGEWRSRIGTTGAADKKRIVLLDPPLASVEFVVKPDGLELIAGQETYLFTRSGTATSAPRASSPAR